MANDRALHIKVPSRLYEVLQTAADRKHISLASLVRMLCSEGLERYGYSVVDGVAVYAEDVEGDFLALPTDCGGVG